MCSYALPHNYMRLTENEIRQPTPGGCSLGCRPLILIKAHRCWLAPCAVNYGGSTGYGREYRNRLRKNWGIVDVDDCCNAATHLAREDKADEQRLCISGGSAGGYTTLACLAFK